MENSFAAYTKSIDGVTFYFVKHFQTFPEYKNVPSFLESYGMHTDFYKACKIAMVNDKLIQHQLSETLPFETSKASASAISRRPVINFNFKNWPLKLPGLLRLANLR